MKEAPEAFPKACGAAPVMERKVHVPFRKSSCSLSRSRMRHSNQPSSSRVSRSTSREAPWVSDTRPAGGEERLGVRGVEERVGDTRNRTGSVSKRGKRVYNTANTKATVKAKENRAQRRHQTLFYPITQI